MNYKELLTETTAGVSEKGMDWYVDTYCPHHIFKGAPMDSCDKDMPEEACHKCWEREVPEDIAKAAWDVITKIDDNTLNEIADKVNSIPHEQIMSAKDIKAALECAAEKRSETAIEDSGDRTEFPSGAVRDMRTGKGRFDVVPLEVAAHMICCDKVASDSILDDIALFQLTNDTQHLYKALGTFQNTFGDVYTMLLDVAKHFEQGATKYGPDNWRKSIPVWCYIDSATRHYLKFRRGDKNENHHWAFVWNLMCCIWEVDYGEEWRKKKGYFNEG